MSDERPSLADLRIDRTAAPRRPLPSGQAVAVMVAAVLLAVGAAWWFNRTRPVAVRTAPAREVTSSGPATLLNASGYVTARREATVSSKVTGKILVLSCED